MSQPAVEIQRQGRFPQESYHSEVDWDRVIKQILEKSVGQSDVGLEQIVLVMLFWLQPPDVIFLDRKQGCRVPVFPVVPIPDVTVEQADHLPLHCGNVAALPS